MTLYINMDSGVSAYEIGDDFIVVRFKNGRRYTYSYRKAGTQQVEKMKSLAISNRGLCSYINRYAKYSYDRI